MILLVGCRAGIWKVTDPVQQWQFFRSYRAASNVKRSLQDYYLFLERIEKEKKKTFINVSSAIKSRTIGCAKISFSLFGEDKVLFRDKNPIKKGGETR